MTMEPPAAMMRHHLNPCMLIARRGELEVTTILGSCVSVCLWDSRLASGGMNHYMLPLWNGEGLPTPKYGNVAIEKLIERMLQLGSRKENLVAKCFGGAAMIKGATGLMQIGERNIELAQSLLALHRIPTVAHELGGFQGRKVIFNTRSGGVKVSRFASQSAPVKHD
jgi:chemotaxis protein CheD